MFTFLVLMSNRCSPPRQYDCFHCVTCGTVTWLTMSTQSAACAQPAWVSADSICSIGKLSLDTLVRPRCLGSLDPCYDISHVAAGQQSSFTETTYLQLHAATTVLHHDSTNSKFAQKHHAGLLQHLNEVTTHLDSINPTSADIQSAMTDLAKLIHQLQNEHAWWCCNDMYMSWAWDGLQSRWSLWQSPVRPSFASFL